MADNYEDHVNEKMLREVAQSIIATQPTSTSALQALIAEAQRRKIPIDELIMQFAEQVVRLNKQLDFMSQLEALRAKTKFHDVTWLEENRKPQPDTIGVRWQIQANDREPARVRIDLRSLGKGLDLSAQQALGFAHHIETAAEEALIKVKQLDAVEQGDIKK